MIATKKKKYKFVDTKLSDVHAKKWNLILSGRLAAPARCICLVFKKNCFMFEELLASPQTAVYLVSHQAAVVFANDRCPGRSPTTQMNRGAVTAGGFFWNGI